MQAQSGYMPLGQTLKGTNSEGTLINNDKLGMVVRFPTFTQGNQRRGTKTRPGGGVEIHAVLLRNTSGGVLLGKRLGLLSLTAGYDGVQEVNGYATVRPNANVVLIDPWLDSNGVADDDIFWGIIAGPAIVLTPIAGADFNGDISVGAQLVNSTGTTSGATTSGRISNGSIANATDATGAFNQAKAILGRALSARTTGETAADLLVHWNMPAFKA